MTVIVVATVVAVVLLLPALTFRWTGRWSCPVTVYAQETRELVKAGDDR